MSVVIETANDMKQSMIFAAGLGTRLKPLTDTMPKALVRVGGEPLLKRVILRLGEAGFDRIVVNVHHYSRQIIDYLAGQHNFGLDVRVSDETDCLLDTGGGLRKARSLFDEHAPVLMHNVDILSNVDLARFYGTDRTMPCPDCGVPHVMAGATLLVSWRETRRYLIFNRQMQLVGWTNVGTHEVRTPWPELRLHFDRLYAERPGITATDLREGTGDYRLYAFSGIHTFSPSLFPLMDSWPDRFPIMDFYLNNCRTTMIKGVLKPDLRLMDVGKQETLHEAEQFLRQL